MYPYGYFSVCCAGFRMICATTVSVLGILLESVLAWLSAIPVGFLGKNSVILLTLMLLYVASVEFFHHSFTSMCILLVVLVHTMCFKLKCT